MNQEVLRLVLLIALIGGGVFFFLSGFFFSFAGIWIREVTERERINGAVPERIELTQFGPFVRGKAEIPGGNQEFSGFVILGKLRLTRRDHGVKALIKRGFPEEIAHKIDGRVMAQLRLRITEKSTALEGEFFPKKFEFQMAPPRVTNVVDVQPEPRIYRSVALIPDLGSRSRVSLRSPGMTD